MTIEDTARDDQGRNGAGAGSLVSVELLVAPGCASAEPTEHLIRRVAEEAGVQVSMRRVVVEDAATALELGFPGSPTVRVGGRDIEPGAESAGNFGLG